MLIHCHPSVKINKTIIITVNRMEKYRISYTLYGGEIK